MFPSVKIEKNFIISINTKKKEGMDNTRVTKSSYKTELQVIQSIFKIILYYFKKTLLIFQTD